MMYKEFVDRLPMETRVPTQDEYKVIEFVYAWHPSIDPIQGKLQMASLYATFGMRVICDMVETAVNAKKLEEDMSGLKIKLEKMKQEYANLCAGDLELCCGMKKVGDN